MTSTNKLFSGLTRNSILLAFTSFFADISTEMLYPVLPLFLTQVLFAPATIVGLIEGIAEAIQNTIQGFSGWWADRIQNNKQVAMVGYGIAAISKPLIGLSVIWQEVLAGRAMDRLGTGIRSAPRDALIASSVNEEYRGKAFGIEGVGDNLGAVVGPLVSVLLLYLISVDLRTIFYLALIPGMLAFLMIFLVTEERAKRPTAQHRGLSFGSFPPEYWKYIFAIGLFGIGNSSNAFLILRATNIGIPTELTILVYAAFNLVAAISSYPAGSLSDKLGRRNIIILALLIFAITYLGFAVSENFIVIGLLFILYGAYQGVFRATGKAMATDFIPSQIRSTGIGLYATIIGLTTLVASIVGGQLWDRISPSATFYYGAIFAVAGSIALLLLTKNRRATS